MIAPETVWLSFDTRVGRDVIFEPNVFVGRAVTESPELFAAAIFNVGVLDALRAEESANGITNIAMVTIDSISLGDIEVRNVRAAVARPGQLHVTLLGMSFLKQLSRVDFRGRTLVLSQ